jgi:hypothetical protein
LITPTNWRDLFVGWRNYYQGSLYKKSNLARIWLALPKLINWKIWTSRNKEIFEGTFLSPRKFAMVAKVLLVDTMGATGIQNLLLKPLNTKERLCAREFLDKSSTMFYNNFVQLLRTSNWKIRMEFKHFQNWWTSLSSHVLFFYGTSKGNPRLVGVRCLFASKHTPFLLMP